MFDVFSVRDRQNFMAMLNIAEAAAITDIRFVRTAIQSSIDRQRATEARGPGRYNRPRLLRPDNLTTCSACGKPAVIVPLSQTDRTATSTHAIQCQNRPATDQPWRDGMCGHTEYIVRGNL